jgi:PAS domain-containing protein
VDVRLRALPPGDRSFFEFATAALGVLREPRTANALQQALRVRYPAAVVTEVTDTGPASADLGSAGPATAAVIWEAQRTGAASVPSEESGWARTGAWAILDDERRFIEVGAGLARIAELPGRRMLGHRVEDFSNPADPTIRDDIAGLWAEFRRTGVLASTLRFNYADGRPRQLAYRLVANGDGPGRHHLTVTVLPLKLEG